MVDQIPIFLVPQKRTMAKQSIFLNTDFVLPVEKVASSSDSSVFGNAENSVLYFSGSCSWSSSLNEISQREIALVRREKAHDSSSDDSSSDEAHSLRCYPCLPLGVS